MNYNLTHGDRNWYNAALPPDVDENGVVTVIDVLNVSNHLYFFDEDSLFLPDVNPPGFTRKIDVSGDNVLSRVDLDLLRGGIRTGARSATDRSVAS